MRSVDHSINIVEIQNVFFRLQNQEVLKDITSQIHRGEISRSSFGGDGAEEDELLKDRTWAFSHLRLEL